MLDMRTNHKAFVLSQRLDNRARRESNSRKNHNRSELLAEKERIDVGRLAFLFRNLSSFDIVQPVTIDPIFHMFQCYTYVFLRADRYIEFHNQDNNDFFLVVRFRMVYHILTSLTTLKNSHRCCRHVFRNLARFDIRSGSNILEFLWTVLFRN